MKDLLHGTKRLLQRGGLRAFKPSSLLPLIIDFSVMPDGPLPAMFVGTTWTISSGKAINTPALGLELLSDPGLEATYTAGLCATLAKNGSPTVSDGAPDVHGGSHSQQFTATGGSDYLQHSIAVTLHKFYCYSVYGKRTSGSQIMAGQTIYQAGGWEVSRQIDSAVYARYMLYSRSRNAGQPFYLRPIGMQFGSTYDTFIVDDESLKQVTDSSLFSTVDVLEYDVTVRCTISAVNGITIIPTPRGILGGVVLNLDSASNPQNYVIAWISGSYVYLEKCVGGAFTTLLNIQSITWGAGKYLQVTKTGTTYKLYYDGIQIGADQTISDAGIISNTRHGLMLTEDAAIGSFFVLAA